MPNAGDVAGAPDRSTLAAFMLSVTIAGGNAVAIRYVSCETCELDPFWGAATRFLLASLIFAMIAWASHTRLPRGRALWGAVLYGGLQFGAGFGLVYWGLVRAPAGLGQVLLASVPMLTFALALAFHQERFHWEGLVGAAMAIAGIALVFSTGVGAGVPPTSMVAIQLGAVCWAGALIVVKGSPPVDPAVMNAVGMAVGTIALLALTVIFGEAYALPQSASTWSAQLYLVFAGSIVVFWLYVFIVRRWTASAASYQLVLIPLVTVLISAWLQDERVTWAFAAGSILVVAGVYFGALRRSAPRDLVNGRE